MVWNKFYLLAETYLIPGETLIPGGRGSVWARYWIGVISNLDCICFISIFLRDFSINLEEYYGGVENTNLKLPEFF